MPETLVTAIAPCPRRPSRLGLHCRDSLVGDYYPQLNAGENNLNCASEDVCSWVVTPVPPFRQEHIIQQIDSTGEENFSSNHNISSRNLQRLNTYPKQQERHIYYPLSTQNSIQQRTSHSLLSRSSSNLSDSPFWYCISCGSRCLSPPLRSGSITPTCLQCRTSGIIDSQHYTSALKAIYSRVTSFYKTILKLDIEDLLQTFPSTNVSPTPLLAQEIPLELVDFNFFNSSASNNTENMRQLARCECRSTIKSLQQIELYRWVEKIFIVRGLAFEALGGILAHELMHAYMWLSKTEGRTQQFDEALCNMAAIKFLETEKQLLKQARDKGDLRPQIRHRETVCYHRILKLHELEQASSLYANEMKYLQHLFSLHKNQWKNVVLSLKANNTIVTSRSCDYMSIHS